MPLRNRMAILVKPHVYLLQQAEDYGDIQDLVDEAEVIGESPPAEDVEEGTEEVKYAACVKLLCGQPKYAH